MPSPSDLPLEVDGLAVATDHAGDRAQVVARVAVDVSLPHLDRPFDYQVPDNLVADAAVGARVRVRFAGRLRDGFILAITDHSDAVRLQPLEKVVSPEPVLSPAVATLIRSVADHCCGTFADVMRLAVPPRHAATENAVRTDSSPRPAPAVPADTFQHYPTGAAFLAALAGGRGPRAAWQTIPTAGRSGDWAAGFAAAAAATLHSGRGSILIVPDLRDLSRLQAAVADLLGSDAFVSLTADLGPASRYRAFLALARGDVRVVVGTRAAAFAPVHDLGLVALWDDGDDLLSEQRAPYPHARDVLAIRSHTEQAALLFAGYSRSVEAQAWVEQGWLRDLSAERPVLRREAAAVRVAADTDQALARDSAARAARLPHDVFTVIRAGLANGPVLVQVPRAGYLASLVCQTCREPVRCAHCHGPVRVARTGVGRAGPASTSVECGWCGRLVIAWSCPTCADRTWRAPVVGSIRTAEELGKAFPLVKVVQSGGGKVPTVGSDPVLVVATPGAEPPAGGGYAAAVLLDAAHLLCRADLRAEEEALRRWLNAAALVRGGSAGGTVMVVGPTEARAVQALVRIDPSGFARRELVDRTEARFPPTVTYLTAEGLPAAVAELVELVELPDPAEVLGPVDLPPQPGPAGPQGRLARVTLRCPLALGSALTRAVKDAGAVRSARKSEGAVRVRVDPPVIG